MEYYQEKIRDLKRMTVGCVVAGTLIFFGTDSHRLESRAKILNLEQQIYSLNNNIEYARKNTDSTIISNTGTGYNTAIKNGVESVLELERKKKFFESKKEEVYNSNEYVLGGIGKWLPLALFAFSGASYHTARKKEKKHSK